MATLPGNPRLVKSDVLRAANGQIAALVTHYGGKLEPPGYADHGRSTCPVHRGDGYSAAYDSTGFRCYSQCGESFDAPAIVARCEGWDLRRDFPHVLERLAEIVGGQPAPVAQLRPAAPVVREFPPRNIEALWAAMALHDARSEAYLDSRGLLLTDPDLLRYSTGDTRDRWIDNHAATGWRIAIPLRDCSGVIRDIGLRYLGTPTNPREKALLLPGVKARGLAFARPLPAEPPDTLIVCEGMTDVLGATLLWPDAYVLGAPGGGMTAQMVDGYADLIHGRHVVIATDVDEAGNAYAALGINAAWACGAVSVARGTPEIGKDIADEVLARRTVAR